MKEMPTEKTPEKAPKREQFVEKIYQAALAEHEKFKEVAKPDDMRQVIRTVLTEIDELEEAANLKKSLAALTPEVAKNIAAFWVFSGPGTYNSPVKEDTYKNYPWAKNMDHSRLTYAVFLVRKIAELLNPGSEKRRPLGENRERRKATKELIAQSGPSIIYNGSKVENDVVKDMRKRDIIIPPEKIIVVGDGTRNTTDQIKSFAFPANLYQAGKEIGLISHAEHFPRILRMLERYKTLSPDMTIRLFPLATPKEGREEYSAMEARGILYYIYLSPNHDAVQDPYPHTIHGKS